MPRAVPHEQPFRARWRVPERRAEMRPDIHSMAANSVVITRTNGTGVPRRARTAISVTAAASRTPAAKPTAGSAIKVRRNASASSLVRRAAAGRSAPALITPDRLSSTPPALPQSALKNSAIAAGPERWALSQA